MANRQVNEAAAEFQKILDHSGIVWDIGQARSLDDNMPFVQRFCRG